MAIAHHQVRCFDEKTVADLYGFQRVRLGLSLKCERLVIGLSGSKELVWWMGEQGELVPSDGMGALLLPVEIQIPHVAYAEVLEPATFHDDDVATILEVFSACQSLAIRGHWQDGQLYEAVVTLEQPSKLINLGFWSRAKLEMAVDNSSSAY
jgi:hypothetical protein